MKTNKTLFARNVIILAKAVRIIHLVQSATLINLENSTPQPGFALVWKATLRETLKKLLVFNAITHVSPVSMTQLALNVTQRTTGNIIPQINYVHV
jgi:hypothetical protein